MEKQVCLKVSIKQTQCNAFFDGDVLWWESVGAGSTFSKDADAARLLTVALDVFKAHGAETGRAALQSLGVEAERVVSPKDILLQAYNSYGPIFRDAIPVNEAIARLTDLALANVLWDALKPAEGRQLSEQRSSLALFDLLPDWMHDLFTGVFGLDPSKKRLLAAIPGVRPLSFAPVLPHEKKYRLSFPPMPETMPQKERVSLLRSHTAQFFKNILQDSMDIEPAVKNGTLALMAQPKDWCSFTALWVYFLSSTVIPKTCRGKNCDNEVPVGKEYCSKCVRKYGDGYAKSRVLTTYRVALGSKDERYQALMVYLNEEKKVLKQCGLPDGYSDVELYYRDKSKDFMGDEDGYGNMGDDDDYLD